MNDFDENMTLEEQVARRAYSNLEGLTRRVKEISGEPYGVPHLTPDQELWAWTFEDAKIHVDQMRAAGMTDPEIAAHRFPLRPKLMDQAGNTFNAQRKYAQRMEERRLRAAEAGRVPAPPPRQGGINTPPFKPIKEY